MEGTEEETRLAKVIEAGRYASDLLSIRTPIPPAEDAEEETQEAYEVAVAERDLAVEDLRNGLIGRFSMLLESRRPPNKPSREFVGNGPKKKPSRKEGEEPKGKRRNLPYEHGTETEEGREETVQALIARADALSSEEIEEFRELAAAGEEAAETFFKANLRLVVSIAKHYKKSDEGFLDLVQDGNSGLVRAVDKFDWKTGFKFSTYATWWIKQAISREKAKTERIIRLPVHLVDQVNRMIKVTKRLTASLGYEPSPEEITLEMRNTKSDTGITEDKVRELMGYSRLEPTSLDKVVGDNKHGTARGEVNTFLGDLIADDKTARVEDAVLGVETAVIVNNVLHNLSSRDRQVLRMRYGLPPYNRGYSFVEIGKELGVSRERVRQIEVKALGLLRGLAGKSLRELY